jgi:hypothetical protein
VSKTEVEAGMTAPDSYPARTLVARGVAEPAQVEQVNDLLETAGLGRPLRSPRSIAGVQTVVAVEDADPAAVLDAVAAAGARGEEILDLRRDPVYWPGTYVFASAKWPAGVEGQLGQVSEPIILDSPTDGPASWPAPAAGRRRPVVAMLDTGVDAEHRSLPQSAPADPFLTGWASAGLPVGPGPDPLDGKQTAAHGTFVAGLIHRANPAVRLLSLRVTDAAGMIQESIVIEALSWLVKHQAAGNPVDVVCMAFVRPVEGTDDYPDLVAEQLRKLAHRGVLLVASAGNGASSDLVYPAGFAQHFAVDSVGSGRSEADRAPYSNFGDWVRKWRDGTEVVSILPGDRYGRWSGSSFAAAVYAGEQALSAG